MLTTIGIGSPGVLSCIMTYSLFSVCSASLLVYLQARLAFIAASPRSTSPLLMVVRAIQ